MVLVVEEAGRRLVVDMHEVVHAVHAVHVVEAVDMFDSVGEGSTAQAVARVIGTLAAVEDIAVLVEGLEERSLRAREHNTGRLLH